MIAPTRPPMSVNDATLFVAFELGKTDWKLALTTGFGQAVWLRPIASGDLREVSQVLARGGNDGGCRRRRGW